MNVISSYVRSLWSCLRPKSATLRAIPDICHFFLFPVSVRVRWSAVICNVSRCFNPKIISKHVIYHHTNPELASYFLLTIFLAVLWHDSRSITRVPLGYSRTPPTVGGGGGDVLDPLLSAKLPQQFSIRKRILIVPGINFQNMMEILFEHH